MQFVPYQNPNSKQDEKYSYFSIILIIEWSNVIFVTVCTGQGARKKVTDTNSHLHRPRFPVKGVLYFV
jgi:hypothetical protein